MWMWNGHWNPLRPSFYTAAREYLLIDTSREVFRALPLSRPQCMELNRVHNIQSLLGLTNPGGEGGWY